MICRRIMATVIILHHKLNAANGFANIGNHKSWTLRSSDTEWQVENDRIGFPICCDKRRREMVQGGATQIVRTHVRWHTRTIWIVSESRFGIILPQALRNGRGRMRASAAKHNCHNKNYDFIFFSSSHLFASFVIFSRLRRYPSLEFYHCRWHCAVRLCNVLCVPYACVMEMAKRRRKKYTSQKSQKMDFVWIASSFHGQRP